jgi:uncharacterized protein YdhG (YjbR/CyaY superfamily)
MSADPGVAAYIDGVGAAQRPLFDRLQAIVLSEHPDAEVTLSYRMPTYSVGARRLHLGVWKHGVSVYGWRGDRDGGFEARHPELSSGKGTLRITPKAAAAISDDEFRALLGGALEP